MRAKTSRMLMPPLSRVFLAGSHHGQHANTPLVPGLAWLSARQTRNSRL